ncbi:HNH endonuclease [Pendulispora albinea]|uniref:HNH endonuclease n=1 Tax=Pendulispora albinea TaxID=2741071 RepID=UPI00374E1DA1
MPEALQRRVRDRAGNRCEYCRISQERQEATCHVDHVLPLREGGATHFENLALSCVPARSEKEREQEPWIGSLGSVRSFSTLEHAAGANISS